MKRVHEAFQQWSHLRYEIGLIVNHRRWRWLTCWFGGSAGIIVSYRLDRFFLPAIGQRLGVFSPVLLPGISFSADVERATRNSLSRPDRPGIKDPARLSWSGCLR